MKKFLRWLQESITWARQARKEKEEIDGVLNGKESLLEQLLTYLEANTKYAREELLQLQQDLGISLQDIKIFHDKFGQVPSVGQAIGIRNLGIELVMECLEEINNLKES